jgi:hypothetical protein
VHLEPERMHLLIDERRHVSHSIPGVLRVIWEEYRGDLRPPQPGSVAASRARPAPADRREVAVSPRKLSGVAAFQRAQVGLSVSSDDR